MELRHLRYFKVLAETLNFTHAVELLRVQPAGKKAMDAAASRSTIARPCSIHAGTGGGGS